MSAGATRTVQATGRPDMTVNATIDVVWSTATPGEVGLSIIDHTNSDTRATAFLTLAQARQLAANLAAAADKMTTWGATL